MTDPIQQPVAATIGGAAGAAFVVLGIPLAALAAGLLGAGFSYLPRGAEPHEKVPARLLGVVMDAFLGGWLAVALVNIPGTAQYVGSWEAAPIVLAGLLSFAMQAIRLKFAGYFDRTFQAGLNAVVGMLPKRKGSDE